MSEGREMTAGETKRELTNGQRLWLDDPGQVWRIAAGQVNVYAVRRAKNQNYRQVYLDTIGEGRLLFGVNGGAGGEVCLLATAAGVTVLSCLSREEAERAADHPEDRAELLSAVEAWLTAIMAGPLKEEPPKNALALSAAEQLSLAEGERVRAGRELVWGRMESGKAAYGPAPVCEISPGLAVPLVRHVWLTALQHTVFIGLTTKEVFLSGRQENAGAFWQPLDLCHELFIRFMEGWFSGESKRDEQRLMAKSQLQERLLHSAAGLLLRTDMPDLAPVASIGSHQAPLLLLARAVAAQLGVAEEQVRLPAGADPSRQDIVLLRSIIRLAGMQIRQVTLEGDWYKQDSGPLFAFLGPRRRMVALLPVSPERYRLLDPEAAESRLVDEELAQQIDPVAFMAYACLPEKALTLSGFFRFFLKQCWPGDIGSLLFIGLVAGLVPILTPLVTQTIFEDILPIYERQGLMLVVQVMVVSAFATVGIAFARGVTFLRIKSKAGFAAEAALWIRLLSLPAGFFRRYDAGDLAQRMDSVSQISMMLSSTAVSALFNTLFSFWSLLVMLYYSWKLTLVAGLIWVVYFGISALLQWRMLVVKRRLMAATGETAGQVLQLFGGLSKFRLQGAEAQAFYLWARKFGEQWKWNRAFRWRSNWQELVNIIQPVVLSMLIFWLTMHWLTDETAAKPFLTLPQFMGFNAALTGFNATLTGMVAVIGSLLDIVPQFERIRPILETQPEVSEDRAEAGEISGRVEISNVNFRYDPELPPVLRNVSLQVSPGQFAAVVGASGSGKSTLLRLLLGFEKPESGSIYFDGQDLAELNIVSVRAQMGVVLQNGQLMAGDILTNIIGSLPLTVDDAWQAAEMVGLGDDIRAMPMGMYTVISEGASNISGGQRQRILIARAIVHKPRLLLFDEATSALDNKTQAMVTESLDRLNATRIVVAHRLSTITNADVIYVMDKGAIVEQGNYEELMKKEGLFAALARRQIA